MEKYMSLAANIWYSVPVICFDFSISWKVNICITFNASNKHILFVKNAKYPFSEYSFTHSITLKLCIFTISIHNSIFRHTCHFLRQWTPCSWITYLADPKDVMYKGLWRSPLPDPELHTNGNFLQTHIKPESHAWYSYAAV